MKKKTKLIRLKREKSFQRKIRWLMRTMGEEQYNADNPKVNQIYYDWKCYQGFYTNDLVEYGRKTPVVPEKS